MSSCQFDKGKCTCIPEKLIRQILRQVKPVTELDLQSAAIIHTHNLIALKQNLTILNIAQNEIEDISALGQLIQLRQLDLSSNRIVDMSPLNELILLQELRLSNNQIKNITLKPNSMKALLLLDISYNQLSDAEEINRFIQKCQSLQSLNIKGNRIKDSQILPESCSIVNGKIIQEVNIAEVSSMRRLINYQEGLLYDRMPKVNRDHLQQWRKALFKEMVQGKSLQILVSQHFKDVQRLVDLNFKNMFTKIQERFLSQGSKILHLKKDVTSKLELLKTKNQNQALLIQRINYYVQSLLGLSEFSNDNQNILTFLKQIKQTIDELRKSKSDLSLQAEISNQENIYIKQQLQEIQQELKEVRRDKEKIEQIYKNQDQDKQRTINQLKQEIKQINQELLENSLKNEGLQNNEELVVFQLKQQHEREIIMMKHDITILTSKLQNQKEESAITINKQQEKFDEMLKEQADKFTKIYEDVKVEYDLKDLQHKRYEEKLNAEIAQMKQEISRLKIELSGTKQNGEQLEIGLQTEKKIFEERILKLKQDQKQLIELKEKEFNYQIQKEKMDLTQELNQKFEADKQQFFKHQEELHQQILREMQDELNELQNQKRKMQVQNSELLKVIQMKDEYIKQQTIAQSYNKHGDQRQNEFYTRTEHLYPDNQLLNQTEKFLMNQKKENTRPDRFISRDGKEQNVEKGQQAQQRSGSKLGSSKKQAGRIISSEELFKRAQEIMSDSD